ncbi:MAG: TolC family protein, partial [Candidatus Eremiobacteraeota bacterium]|nr:TolC family protein [Candidatus Eremiobacteraeota bacterium]
MKKIAVFIFLVFALTINTGYPAEEMTLDECIKIGLSRNPTLQKTRAKVQESKNKLREARSSYYPSLSFDFDYIRTEPVPEFTIPGSPSPVKIISENNHEFRLGLAQLIQSFGRVENAVAIASEGVDLARLDEKKFTNDLVYKIKKEFYGVLLAGKILDLSVQQENSVSKHLEVARQKFEAGTVARFDVTRSEVS